MVICLEWGCIWSNWCHCHPRTPSSLASFKSRLGLPFWYRFTEVVLEERPLNRCGSSSSSVWMNVYRRLPAVGVVDATQRCVGAVSCLQSAGKRRQTLVHCSAVWPPAAACGQVSTHWLCTVIGCNYSLALHCDWLQLLMLHCDWLQLLTCSALWLAAATHLLCTVIGCSYSLALHCDWLKLLTCSVEVIFCAQHNT